MKNLKKLIDPNTDPSEIDRNMSDILNQKFDKELKNKYAGILQEKYNVSRTPKKKINWLLYSLIGILLLVSAFFLFNTLKGTSSTSNQDYRQMALVYDQESPFRANTITRNSDDTSNRTMAISDFENKNYQDALAKLNAVQEKNKEDLFLTAYSLFKLGKHAEAQNYFDKVIDLNSNTSYIAEARFYKVLSLFAEGKVKEGQEIMASYEEGSWEREKLEEVFDK